MQLINQVNRLNIAVRGVYGEGSGAEGFMYQVSNQRSLGATEEGFIDAVSRTVLNIAEIEENAVDRLLATRRVELTDSVYRAYGLLTNSYKMDSKEFMNLMGQLKLGASLGILKLKNEAALDEIVIKAQPGNLILLADRELKTHDDRDRFRSELVARELLSLAATK
jgi:protein arginine kinase